MSGSNLIDRIKHLFSKPQRISREDLQLLSALDEPKEPTPTLAYALVLMQAARADNTVADVERASVASILTKKMGVPSRDIEALLSQAESLLASGAGMDVLAGSLRETLNDEEKKLLLSRVKGIVGSDGFTSPIEEQIVIRIANLLNISPES